MLNVDTTYASGANLFVGSIDTHLPVIPAVFPSYQVSSIYLGYLNTNGELTCRVVGSSGIGAGRTGIYFMYLTNS